MKTIAIGVTLSESEAWEYAQFLKRVDLSTYKEWSEGDESARTMMQAGEKIRAALAEQGYAPR